MSILDFTTGLFREPANLRSFVDDPDQALKDAGLPDATPDQVHDLLPVVAESMPPDHPLQTVVHSADPVTALQALDIDDLIAEVHDHHHEVERMEKRSGTPAKRLVCRPRPRPPNADPTSTTSRSQSTSRSATGACPTSTRKASAMSSTTR